MFLSAYGNYGAVEVISTQYFYFQTFAKVFSAHYYITIQKLIEFNNKEARAIQ